MWVRLPSLSSQRELRHKGAQSFVTAVLRCELWFLVLVGHYVLLVVIGHSRQRGLLVIFPFFF